MEQRAPLSRRPDARVLSTAENPNRRAFQRQKRCNTGPRALQHRAEALQHRAEALQCRAEALQHRAKGAANAVPSSRLWVRPCIRTTSLIYPPTSVHGPSRGNRLRGKFSNPEKFICMGISKNRLTGARTLTHKCPQNHARPDPPCTRPQRFSACTRPTHSGR
jgi:hypothetical protein